MHMIYRTVQKSMKQSQNNFVLEVNVQPIASSLVIG